MTQFTKEVVRSLAVLGLFFAVLAAIHGTQAVRDRAAYLEGRYGLSFTSSLRAALDEEIGK